MSSTTEKLAVHKIDELSHRHGPGPRCVVWFHGCSLGCPGCFVPEMHAGEARIELEVEELLRRIQSYRDIEGVTFTGGEPLEQPLFADLLRSLRHYSDLSVLVYSGYSLNEIRYLDGGPDVLGQIDVLIDGRYERRKRERGGLLGSSNQRIHLLTGRHELAELRPRPAASPAVNHAASAVSR
jgi:anaerobic ribonucleoside-triphosphate reductase activating protein